MSARLLTPRPVEVRDLFPRDRHALIELLRELSPDEWSHPTVCTGWDVRDVALHILGGDLSNTSRRRDGAEVSTWGPGEDPGAFLARLNQDWVEAGRRFSPRVIVDLLGESGAPLFTYFDSLDPAVLGERVSWAGPGPAPVWLDLAREYMERWVHQQHIRDALDRPGQSEPRFVRPVIAASMHAVPLAMHRHARQEQATVTVAVHGNVDGAWSVIGTNEGWRLFEGAPADAATTIEIDSDDWWRVVTLGMRPEEAWSRAKVTGEADLARAALAAVAIIA
jgi:uncharacterized protein (TIGR03083 family)